MSLIVVDTLSVHEVSTNQCVRNDNNKKNSEDNSSNSDRTICTNQQYLRDHVYSSTITIAEDSTPFRLPIPFP
ncbi:MAG TPA: hypothetical protein VJ729_17100 [Nitrososphaeraceae archaeon]|nr:hypothetical protein [Nitrososphaeraceae archaeon]